MQSKSDNIEVMTYKNANEVIKEIFESLLSRYQIGLKTSMKESHFIFDLIQLLFYKYREVNLKCGESYLVSPSWIKNKKATINPKIKMIDIFNMQQRLH